MSSAEANTVQKGEQKDYYANERNYIHWIHMGVTLGSVAVMTSRFARDEEVTSDHRFLSLLVSSVLAVIAICYTLYSVRTFFWRRVAMKEANVDHRHADVDEPWGPLILSLVLAAGLVLILLLSWTAPGPDMHKKGHPDPSGNYIPVRVSSLGA